MTARKIAVVTAGLTQPSSTRLLAERLANTTIRSLEEHDIEGAVEFIELRDHAHDLTNHLLTGVGGEGLWAAMKTVETADAVIAVTPIFSGSYNGLFKTFFDLLEHDSLRGTPVLMGATAGTARHSLALEHAIRPLFSYMGAVIVPTAVFGATEDWGSAGDDVPMSSPIGSNAPQKSWQLSSPQG